MIGAERFAPAAHAGGTEVKCAIAGPGWPALVERAAAGPVGPTEGDGSVELVAGFAGSNGSVEPGKIGVAEAAGGIHSVGLATSAGNIRPAESPDPAEHIGPGNFLLHNDQAVPGVAGSRDSVGCVADASYDGRVKGTEYTDFGTSGRIAVSVVIGKDTGAVGTVGRIVLGAAGVAEDVAAGVVDLVVGLTGVADGCMN